ncbi:MAG: hypothetical protein ACXAE3_10360 [Candidatus Kariarchaeaceae archaeon]|jgi:hypothetical protein
MANRRGQLFLIEVVIALSVLIILISALFTVQTFEVTNSSSNLAESGNQAISVLVESGLMVDYLRQANYSFYTLGDTFFDSLNQTKLNVEYTVDGILPPLANFKILVERYNPSAATWDRIDVLNLEQSLPGGSEIVTVEHYCPGYDGLFDQYTVQIQMWYEVSG